MDVLIRPKPLSGKITAPPSKSAAHRAAICAALAAGESLMSPVEATADMLATISAAQAIGAKAALNNGELAVEGLVTPPASAVIDCGESGSTLRFFVPIAAALGISASFRGRGRLPARPMDELLGVLGRNGVIIAKNGDEILSVSGRLRPGKFEIGGGTSSQYITGLIFALPLLDGDSAIELTSPLESRGSVDMTVEMQKQFGVAVFETASGYRIPGGQRYKSRKMHIEGDYSSAAFWLCGAALGGRVECEGLSFSTKQADRKILGILRDSGANVVCGRKSITVSRQECKGFDIDISQFPDLAPILAVLAVFSNGVSILRGARRLRFKESDRISAIASGLRALGAGVFERQDELEIIGQDWLFGGVADSFGDHRIAMAMSIAAAYCRNPSTISGAGCVEKSYPDFYREFASLGGVCDVL